MLISLKERVNVTSQLSQLYSRKAYQQQRASGEEGVKGLRRPCVHARFLSTGAEGPRKERIKLWL